MIHPSKLPKEFPGSEAIGLLVIYLFVIGVVIAFGMTGVIDPMPSERFRFFHYGALFALLFTKISTNTTYQNLRKKALQ